MGYRTYIGKIPKVKYESIKDLSYDELIELYCGEPLETESEIKNGVKHTTITHFREIQQGDEMGGEKGTTGSSGKEVKEVVFHKYEPDKKPKYDHRYVSLNDILIELYEFGKYTEFDDKKFYSNFFENKETQDNYTSDHDFWIVKKEYLEHIIEHYKQKIVDYYNKMMKPFFGDDVKFSDFMESIKTSYDGGNKNHTFDFTKITQEQQTQLFEVLHHMRSMRSEWTFLCPYNLERGDQVTNSWKYEYSIFELVKIYKTFDWDNDVLVYYGY